MFAVLQQDVVELLCYDTRPSKKRVDKGYVGTYALLL